MEEQKKEQLLSKDEQKQCPCCKKEILITDRFCQYCGKQLRK